MEKPIKAELNGNLTRYQKDVQGMITREMGSFVDGICDKYKVAIDFKVMILFPGDWKDKGEHGKN